MALQENKAPVAPANPIANTAKVLGANMRPINSDLIKLTVNGDIAVSLGGRTLRYDLEKGAAFDVTGMTISAGAVFTLPGKLLKPGDIFVREDRLFQTITDDGKTVRAYRFDNGQLVDVAPEILPIGGLRALGKVYVPFKKLFGRDPMKAVILSSALFGKKFDFAPLINSALLGQIGDAPLGDGSEDNLLPLMILGGQGGALGLDGVAADGMGGMLPLLALTKGGLDNLDPMVMAMAFGGFGAGANGNGMNMMLPFLLLDKGSGAFDDILPLLAISGGFGGGENGAQNPLAALFMMKALGKKDGVATTAPAVVPAAPAATTGDSH